MHSKCLGLLAVNETRLHEIIADNEVSIDGYDIVCHDRPLNSRNGGGVCFHIPSHINYNVHKDLVFDQLESLSIKISKPGSKSFIVATWYGPPNSLFELFSDFESFVGKLDAEGKEYYLMGDLNCNMLSDPGSHLAALTRSHLIGDLPSGLTKEQTRETMDPNTKTKPHCFSCLFFC